MKMQNKYRLPPLRKKAIFELLNNNVPLTAHAIACLIANIFVIREEIHWLAIIGPLHRAIGALDQCPAFGQCVIGLADIGWPHRGARIVAGWNSTHILIK